MADPRALARTEGRDWFVVVPGMKEDGLHGVDGLYVVAEGDGPENDDDFHRDYEDAVAAAAEANRG